MPDRPHRHTHRHASRRWSRHAALLLAALGAPPACAEVVGDDPPAAAGATPGPAPPVAAAVLPDVYLSPAFPRLSFRRPVDLTHAGDGTGRLFVVEQPGRIRVFEADRRTQRAGVFLDLRAAVHTRHNEEGLLALAFHPRYPENGSFFVYYTADEPRRGVLSRFRVAADDPDAADPASAQVILEVAQPYGNHNGATVCFGPDGMLYVSLGDGGYANDPHGHGQDLSTLLGTIIRIDVDREEAGRPYAIPPDNPFVDRAGARGEIWAYGLRNVWRMSFDRETGALWAGDVGQNRFEEIDLIVRGGNYGWNRHEGRHAFRDGPPPADPAIEPVAEYGRSEGLSVTGGRVYRGAANERLRGAYVYADYVSGRMWGLRHDDGVVTGPREILTSRQREHISTFGEGPDGELYVCTFDRLDGRGSSGRILRIVEVTGN